MTRSRALWFVFFIVAALLPGCDDPAADEHLARRDANMKRTFKAWGDSESRRPDGLAHTLNVLEEKHERDLENSARNPELIQRRLQNDVDRWNARQPALRKNIEEQLRGDPDTIKRTIPNIIY